MNFSIKFKELPPLSSHEIVQYLSSPLFKGIGKKTANLLVQSFGKETLNILDKSPQLLTSIPSLQQYRIDKILSAWKKSQKDPTRGAIALLLGVGASFKLSLNICDRYAHRTVSVLQENPYQLIVDLDGVGFKTADKLALSLGISPGSQHRYLQAVIYTLTDASRQGHCFLPRALLVEKTFYILSLPDYQPDFNLIHQIISNAINNLDLVSFESNDSIYLPPTLAAELRVARMIKERLEKPVNSTQELLYWLEEYLTDINPLSNEQQSALLMAERHRISILTGGPGRGKTHVLKTLVEWLKKNRHKIALAAPTGKAAHRMADMTRFEATTIHRLLQWEGVGRSFFYNQNNPLEIDWLIVDEFSMVDIFLFNSLLKALPSHASVLLVGDADQLPSIGPGMVLRDLLLSEAIPSTHLTTVFRQDAGSSIIFAADSINIGQVPSIDRFTSPSEWEKCDNCALLETSLTQTPAKIVELVRSIAATDVNLNHQLVVLSPMKKGPAGVHNLNSLLQPIFNPKDANKKELSVDEVTYRVGDRVIQLKNRYDTDPAVMNGENGFVVDTDPAKKSVTVEFTEGAKVTYPLGDLEQIMHSFAITCHKAQGSEFQYVIMPLLMSHRIMLTRQLVYTTITRAQSVFIAVGEYSALKLAVATDKPAKRFTQLTTLLLKQFSFLSEKLNLLHSLKKNASSKVVSIAKRLKERNIDATKGQMTSIGSLALSMFENQYGHRPAKQFEVVGKFKFKTYHYPITDIDLVDRAIDIVLTPTQKII
ncbi:MAG: ATP-dependent RecD-like DNA helicase [Prochloraceae cyanobacterium]|nr:ATP-dependent RecD-like DNA helicase [Prochloraceae cyanobacterium]